MLLLEFADAIALGLGQLFLFSLLIQRVGRQAVGVELCVLSILVLGEDFEPLGARRRFLLELKLFLGALGLLCGQSLVDLGLSLGEEGLFVSELPNRWLVLLPVLEFDSKEGQHVISDFVTQLEHLLGTFVRPAFDLVSELGEGVHDGSDRIFDAFRSRLTSVS